MSPTGVDRREKDMMYVIAAAEKNRVSINEETLRKRYHHESEDVRDTATEGLTRMISCQHRALENLREQHKKELDHLQSTLSLDLQDEKRNQISILDTMRRAMALELRYEVDILKQSIGTTVAATKAAADKNSVEELREIIDALQECQHNYQRSLDKIHGLEERFQLQKIALLDARRRNTELISKNEKLHQVFNSEISNLQSGICGEDAGKKKAELLTAELLLQTELCDQLRDELENERRNLKDVQEKYSMVLTESQVKTLKYQADIQQLHHQFQEQSLKGA